MDETTPPEDLREKTIFTTGEAAALCKVSQQTIIRCFDSGRLQGFRVPGSRFRRIPRAELVRFMRENEIPLDALGLGRRTLLVVDDDAQLLDRLGETFADDAGWRLVPATTALEAGLELASLAPDVLVLDVGLPDLDAADACGRIRRRPKLADMRIVVTGGAADEERLLAARRQGAEVLRKPFEIESLRVILRGASR